MRMVREQGMSHFILTTTAVLFGSDICKNQPVFVSNDREVVFGTGAMANTLVLNSNFKDI